MRKVNWTKKVLASGAMDTILDTMDDILTDCNTSLVVYEMRMRKGDDDPYSAEVKQLYQRIQKFQRAIGASNTDREGRGVHHTLLSAVSMSATDQTPERVT